MPRDKDESVNLEKLRRTAKYRDWTDRQILEDIRNRKKTLTPDQMAEEYPELAPFVTGEGSPDNSVSFFIPFSPLRGLGTLTDPIDRSQPIAPKRQRQFKRNLRNTLLVVALLVAAALVPPASFKAFHAVSDSYRSIEIEAYADVQGAYVYVDDTLLGRIDVLESGSYGFKTGWRSLKLVRRGHTLTVKKPGAPEWRFGLRDADGSPLRDVSFTLTRQGE